MAYFETRELAVGYHGRPLIRDITLSLERGHILTLIGPNGAGKSTILKSVSRHLDTLGGAVYIDGRELRAWSRRDLARTMSVVLTERRSPELMTAADMVAMGRYPYTDLLGRLTEADRAAARSALERVNAGALAERDYATLSDGQKQRVLLARAICQEPEVLVLDEPTAYLDIHHKVELLGILRQMARERGTAVLLSLHEIDLAMKVSDLLLCVKGETIAFCGTPEELGESRFVEELYDMRPGSYDPLFGGVELPEPEGEPRVFVTAGGGCGVSVYRLLRRRQIPFATGILPENDVDGHAAKRLCRFTVTVPAFERAPESAFETAAALMERCGSVLDAGTPAGELNEINRRLLARARERGIPIYDDFTAWEAEHG